MSGVNGVEGLGGLRLLRGLVAGGPSTRVHVARVGVRVARVCPVEGCAARGFADGGWLCSQHGRAVVQANRPYLGQATEVER